MIIEPVPTNSPSRRRRMLARLALGMPVLLLVAVAGVALVGRAPEADAPDVAALATPNQDPAEPESSAPADASPRPPAAIPSVLRPRRPPFPVAIDGLVVQSVPQALAGPAVTGRGEVVAIAGYFGMPIVPTDCGDGIDPLGPLCERSTLLAELSWTLVGGAGFGGFGPHLHALAPIGLRLPEEVGRTTIEVRGNPLTAVLVGRFGDFIQDGCTKVSESCEVGFHLDSVAWAEGSPFAIRPFVDPLIDGAPVAWLTVNEAAVGRAVVGSNGIVLETALLRPETLARLDARAAKQIRRADPAAFVWYVRGLRPAAAGSGESPALVWGVVDDTTLRTLATGRVRDQAR
jgi:hypothetical protein